jgi:ADP-heptose:LPS heptosyltransferase
MDHDLRNSTTPTDPPRPADATTPGPGGVRVRMRRGLRSFGRGFEQQVKTLLFGALGTLMRLGSPREPPRWSTRPHRVLLLRYDRIGDMILATGLIRAIVLAQPTVSVDVLASAANAAVLDGNPDVSNVITVRKRQATSLLSALRRIRRARYDAVLDPMFPKPSLTNMLLMWWSGAPYRIGIAGRGNDYALTLPVSPVRGAVHHIDHTAALLKAFGVDIDTISAQATAVMPAALPQGMGACLPSTGWGLWRSQIYLSPSELKEGEAHWQPLAGPAVRLVVNVSVGSAERLWQEERFIAAVKHVQERFRRAQPLLIGATADAGRMERIARATGVQAAHTPHYRQMMAIVATCDLVLTGDTSVTHVACAFGKPVLTLFAGGGGAAFGPYAHGYVLATAAPTLASLEVEPVIEALDTMIVRVASVAGQRRPGSMGA